MANINIDNTPDGKRLNEAATSAANIAKQFMEAGVAAANLTAEEDETLKLTQQLELSLKNIVASMKIRNQAEFTSKQISEAIKDITDRIKIHSADNNKLIRDTNIRLNEQLDNQVKINELAKEELDGTANKIGLIKVLEQAERDYINSQDLVRKLKQEVLDLDQQIYNLSIGNNSLNTQQLNKAKELRAQKGLELRDNSLINDDNKNIVSSLKQQVKENEKIVFESDQLISNIQKAQTENNNLLETLHKEERALAKMASSKTWEEFVKNKFIILASAIGLNNIVNLLFEADKQVVELASNLGFSREIGQNIRADWYEYVKTIKDGTLSVHDMFEAQSNLSKELGISLLFAKEELKTFNDLTQLMGVSVGAAAKLKTLASATNTEYNKYVKSAIKGAFSAQKQYSINVSTKDVLEDIGKLSAGILVKFKGNSESLGAAVVQARKLGLELSKVDSIGESLLNWESSIQNELKAELLTSKELNLERARAAALTGDQATLMNEISSQVGSLTDFNNLNVLAQRSLAEAFGLSRDEMADMLLKQEMINSYGLKAQNITAKQLEEQRNSGLSMEEYLYQQQAQLNLQESFNKSLDKLKQILVNLLDGPFGQIMKIIGNVLNNVYVIKGLFVAISAIITGNMLQGLAKSASAMARLLTLTRLESVFATISTSMKTLGVGALLGGIAATTAVLAADSQANKVPSIQSVQDGIAPSSKGPFTITDNYGATAITAKGDNIAVSPNMKTNNNNYDYKRLEDKLEQLININRQQYDVQKNGNVIKINEFALGKASPLATAKENSRNFF